jgi:DNA-binding CsgD family transcriptional regulator
MSDSSTDGAIRLAGEPGAPGLGAAAAPLNPALAKLMVKVLACASFDDLRASIIAPVCQAIGANSGVFLQFLGLPLDGNTIGRSIGADENTRRATDAYVEGLYTVDPMVKPILDWLRAGDAAPERPIAVLTEIPDWRDEVTYRRFLERYRIGDVLAVAVPTTTVFGPEMMCLGFHRHSDAEPFTQRDRMHVQALLPAIQAVLRNLAQSDALSFSGHLLNQLGDAGDGTNLLVLDQDLRIRHANHRALRRLAGQRTGGEVQVDILGELRKQLIDAPPLVGERTRLELNGRGAAASGAGAIEVEVATFRTADRSLYHLVTELDSAAAQLDMAKRYALTEREREVALLVCRGNNSSVVARQLGIARRTVENHLRSVYSKVGVNNRTQLAARWRGE